MMPFTEIVEGESRLLGMLGANATLGGVRVVAEKTHTHLYNIMPVCSDLLIIVQVAVGVATLVYMVLKIRKILKK